MYWRACLRFKNCCFYNCLCQTLPYCASACLNLISSCSQMNSAIEDNVFSALPPRKMIAWPKLWPIRPYKLRYSALGSDPDAEVEKQNWWQSPSVLTQHVTVWRRYGDIVLRGVCALMFMTGAVMLTRARAFSEQACAARISTWCKLLGRHVCASFGGQLADRHLHGLSAARQCCRV